MGALILSRRAEFVARWQNAVGEASVCEDLAGMAWDVDLVVVDVDVMGLPPDLDAVRARCAHARLIVSGQNFDAAEEIACLGRGCQACCGERLSLALLRRVVEVVRNGGIWLSREAAPIVVARMQRLGAQTQEEPSAAPLARLTERERQVAEEIGRGASNKQIAVRLDISDRTVKAHLSAIFGKLGLSDRVQLALYMNRHHRA